MKLFLLKKIILTIHSGSFIKSYNKASFVKKRVIKKIFKNSHGIITVNDEQHRFLIRDLGVDTTKIKTIPAFIFPSSNDSEISEEAKNFLIQKDTKILISSGFLYEYYGFDIILDFLKKNENLKGIFVFYSQFDKDYRKKIIDKINNLKNVIYFENITPESFNWLLEHSNIYIRNTDRDGDSVAIREAIYWQKQILASDAVIRPEGVYLFKYNDVAEFTERLNELMTDPELGKADQQENFAEHIFKYYSNFKRQ